MKKIFLACAVFASVLSLQAQDVQTTRNAKVVFDATPANPVEKIDAVNNEATSFLNTKTGDVVFAVLVKGFRFEKALMEEHFNENYMESTKYPKSDFKGKIMNLTDVNFQKDGEYKVKVGGKLTLHGITQEITAPATITVKGGKISSSSAFTVKLADYKIERPSVVADKISETVKITVNAAYEPKK